MQFNEKDNSCIRMVNGGFNTTMYPPTRHMLLLSLIHIWFCKMSREVLQYSESIQPELLCTRSNYKEDIEVNDFCKTGIKEECVFNRIPSFHVTTNFSVDIMHDLFESVCNFYLCRLLSHYILDVKLFTLETLNCRFQVLNVGENDKRNRSPIVMIDDLKKKNINMYASQMMFFVRYLGVAVDELVPVDDQFWNLYLNLRQIVDLVTAPSFQNSVIFCWMC